MMGWSECLYYISDKGGFKFYVSIIHSGQGPGFECWAWMVTECIGSNPVKDMSMFKCDILMGNRKKGVKLTLRLYLIFKKGFLIPIMIANFYLKRKVFVAQLVELR